MKAEFHEYRTSNAMDWDAMLSLVRRLYRDGDYRMSLLIGCGCFFGLRISDLLTLDWSMLLNGDKFTIYEKKTGKRRVVKINRGFQKHIADCYKALHITNEDEKCFLSRKKMVYSTQRIMKPLGRFFQVTETLDFKKYFLDIEKIEKYPITFVIKSTDSISSISSKLKMDALKTYPVRAIVDKYLNCIEEIINIPSLMEYFDEVEKNGLLLNVLDEIIVQSKVEFNYDDDDDDDEKQLSLFD